MKPPKPRDPSSHLRSAGALRQQVIRNKKKPVKSDRAAEKQRLRKDDGDK